MVGHETSPPTLAAPTAVHAGLSRISKDATCLADKDEDGSGNDRPTVVVREIARTPSPTPTEARVLAEKARLCDWKKIFNWRRYTSPRGACAYSASHHEDIPS